MYINFFGRARNNFDSFFITFFQVAFFGVSGTVSEQFEEQKSGGPWHVRCFTAPLIHSYSLSLHTLLYFPLLFFWYSIKTFCQRKALKANEKGKKKFIDGEWRSWPLAPTTNKRRRLKPQISPETTPAMT